MINAYEISVGRSEGKRPLGRPRRIWEANIKKDFREIGFRSVDLIRLAGFCEHGNELSGSIKVGNFLTK
jgi:hypothetical protein